MAHTWKKMHFFLKQNFFCWYWKMYPCTSFRYNDLSELLSSSGSTGSGNTWNYEDIYNFGLFRHSSAKVLCLGLGCNAIPLVNAPLDWIMGERTWAGVEVVSSKFSVCYLTCILPLCSSLTGLNKKGIKSAAKSLKGKIWRSLGHIFRIHSSKVLNPPTAAHSP